MGRTERPSWSHSRQERYNRCPRAFFFYYYWKGEPEWKALYDLKQATTIELLSGTIVHDMITLALRRYKATRIMPSDLQVPAIGRYDLLVKQSAKSALAVRRGNRAPKGGVILVEHLRSGPNASLEQAGREHLAETLSTFQGSAALEFITETNHRKWIDLYTDTEERPHFFVTPELGLCKAFGQKVYAVFDFAFQHDGEFIIVDWKIGQKTPEALAMVRRQMATYSLWAMSQGVAPNRLRIAPCFLLPGEPWRTEEPRESDLDTVRRSIETLYEIETHLTERREDSKGNVTFHAKREDFPADPQARKCGMCAYRDLCPEGRDACGLPAS